jgi:hypothetical protein
MLKPVENIDLLCFFATCNIFWQNFTNMLTFSIGYYEILHLWTFLSHEMYLSIFFSK